MPVNTTHPLHDERAPEWQQVDDCVEGAKAIKRAGQAYLPMLPGQKPEAYHAYKARADFLPATGRTADAWLGMLARRAPTVEAPGLDTVLADIDLMGNPAVNYAETVLWHLIKKAFCGTLIDYSTTEARPYVAHYDARDIVNWETRRIDGLPTLTMLVLHETSNEWSPLTGHDAPDPYARPAYDQWREFTLTIAPIAKDAAAGAEPARTVTWKVWRRKKEKKVTEANLGATAKSQAKVDDSQGKSNADEWIVIQAGILTRRQIPLQSIPFIFHGLGDDRTTPTKPPLLDLSDVNLSHYCLSADYAHGLHIAGLPTPWAAGFTSEGDTKLSLGMTTAWVTDDTSAKCGFLEFNGSGLTSIKEALEAKESYMAALGAKAFSQGNTAGKNGEAFETVRLRASSEASALLNIAEAASRGLGEVVRWLAWWAGTANSIKDLEKSHTVSISKDLISHQITPEMLNALTQALQAGALSYDSYFYQLVEGEIIPEGRTVEEERTGIDNNPLPPAVKEPEEEPKPGDKKPEP